MLKIREALETDLSSIRDIYNYAVLNTTATFDTEALSEDQMKKWFDDHFGRFPVLVGTVDDQVIGWSSLSEWSGRCAYEGTVEISVYIHKESWGKGYGKSLTSVVMEAGRGKFHTILSRISAGNDTSIHIHKSLGFVDVGLMREVGKKFGKYIDVRLLQYIY